MKAPWLLYAAEISCLFPAVAGLYRWKNLTVHLKLLTIFFGYTVIHVVLQETLRRMSINNIFLVDIHQIVELEFFLFLFWVWSKNKYLRIGIQSAGVIYAVFWSVNKWYFQKPAPFNEIIATVANIFLIIFSISILYELGKRTTIQVTNYAIFWIGTGIVLYCAGTVIIFSFSNTILQLGMTYFVFFWHINWSLTIIVNLLFSRSFFCRTF